MSAARDPSLRGLDACGCCAGIEARTPVAVQNRPGLAAVAYRVGTHGTFLDTLLAELSASGRPPPGAPGGWRPPLQALTAREGDFTPALLDAWAVVGDVLTFYSERIANESWLRTATERRSVLELARAIGYELNPGVAASTHLAFTLEEVPGAPERVTVVPGTRAQSIPGPQEKPQSFETVEPLDARPVWNRLPPRLSAPQQVRQGTRDYWLAGVPGPVQPGDFVGVWIDGASAHFFTVVKVTPDAAAGRTLVTLDGALPGPPTGPTGETGAFGLVVFRQRASLLGHNAADWRLLANETRSRAEGKPPNETTGQYPPPTGSEWPGFPLAGNQTALELDAVYPRLLPGSWLVLDDPDSHPRSLQAATVSEVATVQFGIGGRVTRVGFAQADLSMYGRRTSTVHVQSEALARADAPLTEPVRGRSIPLGGRVQTMEKGRTVIVRGRPARVVLPAWTALNDADGKLAAAAGNGQPFSLRRAWPLPGPPEKLRLLVRDDHGVETYAEVLGSGLQWLPALEHDGEVAEVARVDEWDDTDPGHPVIELAEPLRHVYDRATVGVMGNVAFATHGESVAERLGSGDGARAFQRFTLRQPPLTHTPSSVPSGGASTLEVRVGEVAWTEVPSLFGRGPRDRVFVTRRQDDGATVVQFGDGREGARLPTGRENVGAAYRKGIGRDGNVRARQLSLLLTRELGVKEVVNPLPATGGMEPQERDHARDAAPVTVLTMDRVVSLRDYEHFARAYAGVSKAQAVWAWDGGRRGVLLTVAGPAGDEIPEGGAVHVGLLAALAAAGDPHVPVRVRSYRPRRFRVEATLRRDPDRLPEQVLRGAEAALRARYSFAAGTFGRAVWLGDVIATLQNVPGVASVDVDLLYREDAGAGTLPELKAASPKTGGAAGTEQPAELLLLDLRPGDLKVVP
ncbi:MAG TPA: putative baseplate assembly protein [Longimicrobium sp.]|nr:putative baseplate assembly protein [Longimicrobium sp.]